MMSTFALLSVLVTVGAVFSLLSFKVLKLPTTIGTMLLSLAGAAALIGLESRLPGLHYKAADLVRGIDFNAVVLHGMLAFLLFAGALHLDLQHLWAQRGPVLALALGATAISTVVAATGFYYSVGLVGLHVGWMGAFLFGALISPTDPIAVLDMLKRAGAPPELEVQLAGESLFNDGIGAVLFLALLAAQASGTLPSAGHFASMLLLEAGGGIALGVGLGYGTYRLLCVVDNYQVEVLLTVALAMGGYALADGLGLSAPLEVVAAGLTVNGWARNRVMSELTREHVASFWDLTDYFLNIVLFLLMGLEILVLPFTRLHLIAGLVAVPVVLAARLLSVGLSVGTMRAMRRWIKETRPGSIIVLTWGGLRGGLAVALVLTVPGSEQDLLLIATFVVVVFSVVVQGLTLPRVMKWVA